MTSFSERKKDFIREIKAPLNSDDDSEKSYTDIQSELLRKFEELFGTVTDEEE